MSLSGLIEAEVGQRSAELQGRYGDVIELMKINSPGTALMHYVKALSHVDAGWTPQLREDYFRYFAKLLAGNGGASYNGFIIKIRDKALENAPLEVRASLKDLSGEELIYVNDSDLANLPQPQGPGKNWELSQLMTLLESKEERDLENGAKMYQATLCVACHAFKDSGSNLGPDLTQVGTRFGTEDLLDAIINPNKAISDQYAATEITLNDEKLLWGRVINETEDTVFLTQNPMRSDQITKIAKATIESQKPSERSIMFPALLNRLNEEEVKDLIYYLQSGSEKQEVNP